MEDVQIEYLRLFIGGEWREPLSAERIGVRSPTSNRQIGSVPAAGNADIDAAVAAARSAFDDPRGWSTWSRAQRAPYLRALAVALENRGGEMARRVTTQNGMPIWLAQEWEAGFPPFLLRTYADIEQPEEEVRHGLLGRKTVVLRKPIGVVAAIIPWNVPQAIGFLKMAPALAAGCTVVLKPSPETVLDAFLLAEAVEAAGLPAGVINIVPGGREAGAYLVEHPGVDKVSFTGSTAAGRSIGEACGRLIRPVTLELGGKSAAVILDDLDLEASIDDIFASTLVNNGQVCWLATRILAPRSRYEEIVDAITDMVESLPVGDPLDPVTKIGPVVSEAQRERIEAYIEHGKKDGSRLVTGGGRPAGLSAGWFVEPTVFADVAPTSRLFQEEIFGPVLTITPYDTEDEALRLANDSKYGLAGSVWGAERERAAAFARRVETGTISVNKYSNDPVAPFGGIKLSGIGREQGVEGLEAYQQLRSIYLDEPNDEV